MRTVSVQVDEQAAKDVPVDTPVMAVLPARAASGLPVLGALVNNEAVTLSHPLSVSSRVTPLTLGDLYGWRIYRSSLGFLLAKAVHETFPGIDFRVRHSLGDGLYCTVDWPEGPPARERRHVSRLENAMRGLVARDLPLDRVRASYEDALRMFEASGQADKYNLLSHRNPPAVDLVDCAGFLDLLQEPIVHRTGLLETFALIPHPPGFVLQIPPVHKPGELRPLDPQPHLFEIYREHIAWGRILGVTTVGELNAAILARQAEEFMRTAEALHDQKLATIAAAIAAREPAPRLVLIAGPSSAGKTTFAKRLVTHLRVNGLRPVMISTDDYFVGDERNPREADGTMDYEHIEAVDLPRLNGDLAALLDGQAVHLPLFDFPTKTRRDRSEATRLGARDVIVMEGIHSLNPQLTSGLPDRVKFHVYISALTQLGIDHNNRISTTDNRLLRRMVRDSRYRGHGALATLRRWPSVRRGEERWVFPFQQRANATFNSALDYELAVLKSLAVPLLNQIKPSHREYAEARRLTGFLHNFLEVPSDAVPGDSILREYIGGSQLPY
jgi:uridine kinase